MFDPKNPHIANRSPLLTGRGNAHHFYVVYSCVHNVFLLPFRPYAPCPIKPAGVPVMSPKNGAMQMDTPFLNRITQYLYYKTDFCIQMGRWFFLYYTQPSGVLQFQQPFSWAEGFFHRPGYPYIAPQKVYYQYPLKRKKGVLPVTPPASETVVSYLQAPVRVVYETT